MMSGIAPRRFVPIALGFAPVMAASSPAIAQQVPTIDTEDASLGSASVGSGRVHPSLAIDLRNGDFARGNFDDDAADLDRLPVHFQLGFAAELHRNAENEADAFLVFNSSNGFHAPVSAERASPGAWYESNNAVALVLSPARDLRTGIVYTIKTSPNGVSSTTHELSLTSALGGESPLGALSPTAVVTWRPKGGRGLFTQIGIEPSIALTQQDDGPAISFPTLVGIGWDDFYEAGSGDAAYGSIGGAYSHPFEAAGVKWQLRAEALAVLRSDRLRHLGGPDAEHGTVVPIATVSLRLAY
ncbi:hypothetical protein [Sphingomonas sp. S2-65]|uniref:hypothetical protein n=1 Tax=Sphingomonas sp. S2-65 TaxID=2903960 RepID=UPI001F2B0C53|nr:hypothetical protein [Sphingomonas sp. S2-65]UYY58166.1 hypothetical protein LZ586_16120 [Sphingomonas sp. S2-65]